MTRRHQLAYAGMAVPLAFLGLPLYVYVPAVYAELPAVSLGMVGLVLLLARLLDLVTDPLVGVFGDRWRARVHPFAWIGFGVPVTAAGAFALFNPDAGADAVYLALALSITYLGWTLVAVPYHAWGAELEITQVGRRRLAAWREAGMLSGGLAALLAAVLLPGDPLAGMAWLMVLLLPAGLLLLAGLPRETLPPQPRRIDFRQAWLATGRAMRRLLGVHFLNALAAGIPATLFLLYAAEVLALDSRISGLLLLLYFVCGIAALPLWTHLAGRIGDVQAWLVAILLAAAGFLPAALIGPGDLWVFVLVCLVTGATLGADIALPAALQARLANQDSQRLGVAREAVSFGLWGMAGKLALAFAAGLSLPLLELFPEGPARSEALPWIYALAPVLVKLLTALWLYRSRHLLSHPSTTEDSVNEPKNPAADRAAVLADGGM